MGIGLGATVYLPTFAPRRVTHSATLPAMDGINALLLGYRLQGSETRRLKVGTGLFFFSCLHNSVSVQAQMISCGCKLERHVCNLSMFLLCKTNRNHVEPGTEPDTVMRNSKGYCACVQLITFSHSKTFRNQAEPGTEPGTIMENSKEYCSCTFEEPLGTTLNQARNQAR